jgi:hypothetical protein
MDDIYGTKERVIKVHSHPHALAGWSAINTERRKDELRLHSDPHEQAK